MVNTYHTHTPFITDSGEGLTYDLADFLTEKSSGQYRFQVIPMTRERVNISITRAENCIIPWVNPLWFSDMSEEKYMWSENCIMSDGNAVISRIEDSIEYYSPESVIDLRFGGIRGHKYADIDELVEEGFIDRYDNEFHRFNFRMLIKNRIDFTIMPLSGANFLIGEKEFADQLYISSRNHSTYTRKVIIGNKDRALQDYIDEMILFMQTDPRWVEIISEYEKEF